MKIKNVSTSNLQIPEIKDNQGAGLLLSPQAMVIIFDEDAEKSPTLASYIAAGFVTKISDEEPDDSTGAADIDVSALEAAVAAQAVVIEGLATDVAAMQITIENLILRIEDLESS